jgi:hypothetical protein
VWGDRTAAGPVDAVAPSPPTNLIAR